MKAYRMLWLAAGAALAIGCGLGVEEGTAPAPEQRPEVSAQSEACPGSAGYCLVPSGTVYCGANRPRASAFLTADGWCIHYLACGSDRPVCAPRPEDLQASQNGS